MKAVGSKISDGLGITWLPYIIIADALHSGELVELLPDTP